jgi:hypothetical protein
MLKYINLWCLVHVSLIICLVSFYLYFWILKKPQYFKLIYLEILSVLIFYFKYKNYNKLFKFIYELY